MYGYHPYKGKAVFSATDPGLRHRPTDRESLQREARQLAAIGLKAQDIAEALRLGITATQSLLKGAL
jgi:hypothetical protein